MWGHKTNQLCHPFPFPTHTLQVIIVVLITVPKFSEIWIPLSSTFKANKASGTSVDHVSALVSFRFPIHLNGFNHFISNVGGGISLLNSAMTVAGELLLDSNTATYGAGMSLDDICLVCDIHICTFFLWLCCLAILKTCIIFLRLCCLAILKTGIMLM